MARLIAETPVLKGEEAVCFEKLRTEVENLNSEQRVENTRNLNEGVTKAKKYIFVRN